MNIKQKSNAINTLIKRQNFEDREYGGKASRRTSEQDRAQQLIIQADQLSTRHKDRLRMVSIQEQALFEELLMEQHTEDDVDQRREDSDERSANPFAVYDGPQKGGYTEQSNLDRVATSTQRDKKSELNPIEKSSHEFTTSKINNESFDLEIESRDFSKLKLKGIKENEVWNVTISVSKDNDARWFSEKREIIERSLSKRFQCKINVLVQNDH